MTVGVEEAGVWVDLPSRGGGLDARAFVEGAAEGRVEALSEKSDTSGVVEVEASFGVREGEESFEVAKSEVKDLGSTGPLGWVIMKKHDAIAERHRPGGPSDKASVGEEGFDPKHTDTIEKDSDVAASDGDGGAVSEDRVDLFALLLDGGALKGAPSGFEFLVDELETLEVVLIEALDGGDGVGAFGEDESGIA